MNVEELRYYCLSLDDAIEEKFPFQKFHGGEDILAMYIHGHVFVYFDINNLAHVTMKCQSDKISELIEHYPFIDKPYNGNPKYWISVDATRADDDLLKRLIDGSFRLVSSSHPVK